MFIKLFLCFLSCHLADLLSVVYFQLDPGKEYVYHPPTQGPIHPPYEKACNLRKADQLSKLSDEKSRGTLLNDSVDNRETETGLCNDVKSLILSEHGKNSNIDKETTQTLPETKKNIGVYEDS